MEAFSLHAAISNNSGFQSGSFEDWYIVHADGCTGRHGVLCKDKMYQCEQCYAIRMSTKLLWIRGKIQKRGLSLRSAIEVVTRVHLTSTDYSFMCSFIKTSDEWFSLHSRELKLHIKSQIEYYKLVQLQVSPRKSCQRSCMQALWWKCSLWW